MEKAIKIRKTMSGQSKEEMATQVFRGTKRETIRNTKESRQKFKSMMR